MCRRPKWLTVPKKQLKYWLDSKEGFELDSKVVLEEVWCLGISRLPQPFLNPSKPFFFSSITITPFKALWNCLCCSCTWDSCLVYGQHIYSLQDVSANSDCLEVIVLYESKGWNPSSRLGVIWDRFPVIPALTKNPAVLGFSASFKEKQPNKEKTLCQIGIKP